MIKIPITSTCLLMLLLLLPACASNDIVLVDVISIDELIMHPDIYNDRVIQVQGCVNQTVANAVHLMSCKHSVDDADVEHIDVVGRDDFLGFDRFQMTTLRGLFRSYSSDFIGIGYLNSNIGLLEILD